jgi:hypothetical protein
LHPTIGVADDLIEGALGAASATVLALTAAIACQVATAAVRASTVAAAAKIRWRFVSWRV